MSKPVLVCFAVPPEAKPFRKYIHDRADVRLLITGMGARNTERAVRAALEETQPGRVFTCGLAGGLNPQLTLGTVMFATENSPLQKELAAAGAEQGRFICVSRIATTAAEKEMLRRSTGADAVEMESETIHALCRERSIPCVTVRVILDTAGEDLPLDFNQLVGADLSLSYSKLALAVAKSPGKIGALLRLQKQTQFAAAKLAAVLAKVI